MSGSGERVISYAFQAGLIQAAMAAYGGAFVVLAAASLWRRRDEAGAKVLRGMGMMVYFAGFLVAAAAVVCRWIDTGAVPLQNLYEVFLGLGALVFVISVFCRRFLGAAGEAWDALLGLAVLFPVGFVFDPAPRMPPPALQSWLLAPHVAAYVLAYLVMAKATIQAVGYLLAPGRAEGVDGETAGYRLVCLGFPALTLGLLLGAVWGKLAWGDYWNWDAKELWSLAAWLVFAFYLHFRHVYARRFQRANCMLVVAGMLAILVTLLWVSLGRLFGGSLHGYA